MKSCFRKAKIKSRRRDFPKKAHHLPPLFMPVFSLPTVSLHFLSYPISLYRPAPLHQKCIDPYNREFPRPVNGSSHPYFSPDFPIKPCNRCSPGIIFGTKIEPVLSPERSDIRDITETRIISPRVGKAILLNYIRSLKKNSRYTTSRDTEEWRKVSWSMGTEASIRNSSIDLIRESISGRQPSFLRLNLAGGEAHGRAALRLHSLSLIRLLFPRLQTGDKAREGQPSA